MKLKFIEATKPKTPKKGAALAGFLIPADAIVSCPACDAVEGEPCKAATRWDEAPLESGHVHIGRRMRRLLLTALATSEERARLEAEAVLLLRTTLKASNPSSALPAAAAPIIGQGRSTQKMKTKTCVTKGKSK
jgi:hypothetical protein